MRRECHKWWCWEVYITPPSFQQNKQLPLLVHWPCPSRTWLLMLKLTPSKQSFEHSGSGSLTCYSYLFFGELMVPSLIMYVHRILYGMSFQYCIASCSKAFLKCVTSLELVHGLTRGKTTIWLWFITTQYLTRPLNLPWYNLIWASEQNVAKFVHFVNTWMLM